MYHYFSINKVLFFTLLLAISLIETTTTIVVKIGKIVINPKFNNVIVEDEGDDAGEDEEDGDECGGEEGSGSGDIEGILALGGGKCKSEGSGEGSGDEMGGADALAAALGAQTCDMDGMDDKLAECLSGLDERVKTLEQTVLSGEGGGLEDQITLVLVKKGVIDCENDTQCDDDKACLDSLVERGRMLCESPCDEYRMRCDVPHSICVVTDHVGACECKEGFHGNGTENCIPDGFTEEENGKHYKMFDDKYVEFDEAVTQCEELGARSSQNKSVCLETIN